MVKMLHQMSVWVVVAALGLVLICTRYFEKKTMQHGWQVSNKVNIRLQKLLFLHDGEKLCDQVGVRA